jgi:hypothetical protein
MIEEIMEVFMDDFLVYGKTFDHCLENLDSLVEMPRKGPSTKLGKVPFYGPRRHCSWTPSV